MLAKKIKAPHLDPKLFKKYLPSDDKNLALVIPNDISPINPVYPYFYSEERVAALHIIVPVLLAQMRKKQRQITPQTTDIENNQRSGNSSEISRAQNAIALSSDEERSIVKKLIETLTIYSKALNEESVNNNRESTSCCDTICCDSSGTNNDFWFWYWYWNSNSSTSDPLLAPNNVASNSSCSDAIADCSTSIFTTCGDAIQW